MKLLHCTDIHLDTCKEDVKTDFYNQLNNADCDAILITGDIGTNSYIDSQQQIARLARSVSKQIYFVAGNHEYYGTNKLRPHGEEVRRQLTDLCGQFNNLNYLTASSVIRVSDATCLIGEDSWYDCRNGDHANSPVILNDFLAVGDLRWDYQTRGMRGVVDACRRLADGFALNLRKKLSEAVEHYNHVIIAIHVPPFTDCATYEGRKSGPDYLPWFSCRAAGELIWEFAKNYEAKMFTVYCGHCHGGSVVDKRSNLRVYTGEAEYTKPRINGIYES